MRENREIRTSSVALNWKPPLPDNFLWCDSEKRKKKKSSTALTVKIVFFPRSNPSLWLGTFKIKIKLPCIYSRMAMLHQWGNVTVTVNVKVGWFFTVAWWLHRQKIGFTKFIAVFCRTVEVLLCACCFEEDAFNVQTRTEEEEEEEKLLQSTTILPHQSKNRYRECSVGLYALGNFMIGNTVQFIWCFPPAVYRRS